MPRPLPVFLGPGPASERVQLLSGIASLRIHHLLLSYLYGFARNFDAEIPMRPLHAILLAHDAWLAVTVDSRTPSQTS